MVMIILRLKKYYSDSGEMNGGKNDGNGGVPVRLTDVNCIDPAIWWYHIYHVPWQIWDLVNNASLICFRYSENFSRGTWCCVFSKSTARCRNRKVKIRLQTEVVPLPFGNDGHQPEREIIRGKVKESNIVAAGRHWLSTPGGTKEKEKEASSSQ